MKIKKFGHNKQMGNCLYKHSHRYEFDEDKEAVKQRMKSNIEDVIRRANGVENRRDRFCNFKISKSNQIIFYTNMYLTDPPEIAIRVGENGPEKWFTDVDLFTKELDRLVKK